MQRLIRFMTALGVLLMVAGSVAQAQTIFGPQQVIISKKTSTDGAQSVYAADLDGDGDQDVLSASYIDDKIAWYENLLEAWISAYTVALTPLDDPVVIPPEGGVLAYQLDITNSIEDAQAFQHWTEMTYDTSVITRLSTGPFEAELAAGQTKTQQVKKTLGGWLHAGSYTYCGYVGTYPDDVIDSDCFTFNKRSESALTVTTSEDTDDDLCDAHCSLREAIGVALPSDEVVFDPTVTDPIVLTLGQLDVDKDLTIIGPSETELVVSGNAASRIFWVSSGVTVAISDLTLSGGLSGANEPGGGLYNEGTLTLTRCLVTGNTAGDDGSLPHTGDGGGIYNTGTLTLVASHVTDNTVATDWHDDPAGRGGGIYNTGTLSLTASSLTGNSAGQGEGFFGGGSGGGIYSTGKVTITQSTVSGNWSGTGDYGGDGGGIYSTGTLTMAQSTVSGNSASSPIFSCFSSCDGGSGGGIFSTGTLVLTHTTIVGNHAGGDGGEGDYGEGGGLVLSGDASFFGNLIVGNDRPDGPTDCYGAYTSSGYNLVGEGTGCQTDGPGDLTVLPEDVFTLVLEATLADNEGETQTHALLEASPAIDAIPEGVCMASEDQRGYPRPVDGDLDGTVGCDIGSYEYGAEDVLAKAGLAKRPVQSTKGGHPTNYALDQNYPNPFNPSTEISYALPESASVQLLVYNVLGREVARLVDGQVPAGVHRVTWQAGALPSGLYVYRLTAGAYTQARTMVLLR